jgi:hypothetical protein
VIQIEIENGTTFRRRIFLHASPLSVTEPIPLALTAWKYFDLEPGVSIGTVDGNFQVGVRVSRIVHGVDHRTVFAEAELGDAFRVELTDGIPVLSRKQNGPGNSLEITNGETGPQSSVIDATLYRDYAPLLHSEILPNQHESFGYPAAVYCYSSMPFNGAEEALALEPIIGKMDLGESGNLRLQLVPDGSSIHWKVNGESVDMG